MFHKFKVAKMAQKPRIVEATGFHLFACRLPIPKSHDAGGILPLRGMDSKQGLQSLVDLLLSQMTTPHLCTTKREADNRKTRATGLELGGSVGRRSIQDQVRGVSSREDRSCKSSLRTRTVARATTAVDRTSASQCWRGTATTSWI